MYNIKFKVPTITGETIHTINHESDEGLIDSWDTIVIGKITPKLLDVKCDKNYNIHFVTETHEKGYYVLNAVIYPLVVDTNHPKGVTANTNRDIKVVLIEVNTDTNEYVLEDDEWVYNPLHEGECDGCECCNNRN